jgi:hypothetical protein
MTTAPGTNAGGRRHAYGPYSVFRASAIFVSCAKDAVPVTTVVEPFSSEDEGVVLRALVPLPGALADALRPVRLLGTLARVVDERDGLLSRLLDRHVLTVGVVEAEVPRVEVGALEPHRRGLPLLGQTLGRRHRIGGSAAGREEFHAVVDPLERGLRVVIGDEDVDEARDYADQAQGQHHVPDRLLAFHTCHAPIVAGVLVCSSVGPPAHFVGLRIESARTLIRPSSYQKGALR